MEEPRPQRDELRREITRILNHDIRNPLTALMGHIEMLREQEAELPEDAATSLRAMERAGWKVNELIGSVTDLLVQIDELDNR